MKPLVKLHALSRDKSDDTLIDVDKIARPVRFVAL